MTKAMVFTGQGIFTGALTTAGAFLAMEFTNFKGIQGDGHHLRRRLDDLFYSHDDDAAGADPARAAKRDDHQNHEDETAAHASKTCGFSGSVLVIGVTAVLCALAVTQIVRGKVRFDYNLIEMQSPNLQSVIFKQKLFDSANVSLLSGAVIANSLTDAVAKAEQIQKLPSVADGGVEPPFYKTFPADQAEKLKLADNIKHRHDQRGLPRRAARGTARRPRRQPAQEAPVNRYVRPIMPILIIPIVSGLIVGVVMLKVVGAPIASVMTFLGAGCRRWAPATRCPRGGARRDDRLRHGRPGEQGRVLLRRGHDQGGQLRGHGRLRGGDLHPAARPGPGDPPRAPDAGPTRSRKRASPRSAWA